MIEYLMKRGGAII